MKLSFSRIIGQLNNVSLCSVIIHFEHNHKQEMQFSLVFYGSLVIKVSNSNGCSSISIILNFFLCSCTVSQTSNELFPEVGSSYLEAETTLKICQCYILHFLELRISVYNKKVSSPLFVAIFK